MNIYFLLLFLCITTNLTVLFSESINDPNIKLKPIKELINKEDFSQGLSLLNTLSKQNPNDNDIYRSYAELFLKLKSYDEALSYIEKAILLAQNNAINYVVSGNIYREKKDFLGAKNAYEKAIKTDPGLAIAYYEYAILNLKYYHIQEAEKLLNLAGNFIELSWRIDLLKAQIAKYKNENTKAEYIFFEIIQKFPYEEEILNEFADFYLFCNQPEKAVLALKEVNQRFGETLSRNEKLGNILFYQKNYEEALKYYEKNNVSYENLSSKDRAILKWKLYNLYLIFGDKENSYKNLKKCFELEPHNQLYIIAFYNYLWNNTFLNATKKSFISYLEKIAIEERLKGVGYYYLSILQKIVKLSPESIFARDRLLDYAKIHKNEYAIKQILSTSYEHDKKLEKHILVRNHFEKTQQLNQEKNPVYQYTNMIFLENNRNYFGEHIKKEIQEIEHFFPNVLSVIELEKSFREESRNIFENNMQYNIITYMIIDEEHSVLNITIYNKNGVPIQQMKHYYTPELLTESLITYVQKISDLLPPIGYILKRYPKSTFEISLGASNKINTNSILVLTDRYFKPIAQIKVIESDIYRSKAQMLDSPSSTIDLQSSFVIPLKYIPSLNKDQMNNKNKDRQDFLLNFEEISQIHYKITENID